MRQRRRLHRLLRYQPSRARRCKNKEARNVYKVAAPAYLAMFSAIMLIGVREDADVGEDLLPARRGCVVTAHRIFGDVLCGTAILAV